MENISNKRIVLISVCNQQALNIRPIYEQLLNNGFKAYMIHFGNFDFIYTKPPSKEDYDILIDVLKEINPEIVGISSVTLGFDISKKIISKLRENINPQLILFGGIHARIKPEDCIKYADVVCIGEGDESIPELCDKFYRNKNYDNIPNLWIKKKNYIVKNPIKCIENLDIIALPNFESKNVFYIENGKITKGKWLLWKEGYGIIASRGCPYRCTYCINSTYKQKVLRRSVDNVIKELKNIKNYFKDIKRIYTYDEVFPSDLGYLEDFCKKYKKEINLPFYCQLHPTLINDKAISLLKEAGVDKISIGVQSGSRRFREEVYERYTPNKMIYNAIEIINKYGIRCELDVILKNPLEGNEDLKESAKFLLSLPKPFSLRLFGLVNFPKTKLTERLLKEGLIKREDSLLSDSYHFRFAKEETFTNSKDEYWFYIFNIISKPFIPRVLISFLINDIFIKNPRFMMGIFRTGNKIYQVKEKILKKKYY